MIGTYSHDHASDDILGMIGLKDKAVPEVKFLKADHVLCGTVAEVVKAPSLDEIGADLEKKLLGNVVAITPAASARASFTVVFDFVTLSWSAQTTVIATIAQTLILLILHVVQPVLTRLTLRLGPYRDDLRGAPALSIVPP